MSYEPFKCPDCSTWWRGETHRCETPTAKNVKKEIYERAKDLDLCIRCGKTYSVKYPHNCELDGRRYKKPGPNIWKPTPKNPDDPYPQTYYHKD